jgi:general stress protein CsbA
MEYIRWLIYINALFFIYAENIFIIYGSKISIHTFVHVKLQSVDHGSSILKGLTHQTFLVTILRHSFGLLIRFISYLFQLHELLTDRSIFSPNTAAVFLNLTCVNNLSKNQHKKPYYRIKIIQI